MYKTILYQPKKASLTITINRPENSNALEDEVISELIHAFQTAENDQTIKVIILTGAGKNFSSGGDIASFKQMIDAGETFDEQSIRQAGELSRIIKTCLKPVIAMVNGAAASVAFALALACDYRILDTNSRFIMSFINMGLSGDTGSLYLLNQLVGNAKAIEIMAFGEPISASEASRLGLATKVVPAGELQAATVTFAKQFCDYPSEAFAKQKQTSYDFFYQNLPAFTRREAINMRETSHTADFKEAVTAFIEKRPPKFIGR